jgi:AcrR family transcriptional regulator
MQMAAYFSDNVDIHLHICHANLYGKKRLEVRVALPGRNSERTKARIFRAARRLFAERDIASVGIREIASAAGVSHGLVKRYCGTREQMIAEIVRQEVERLSVSAPPIPKRAPADSGHATHRFNQATAVAIARESSAPRPGAGERLRQRESVCVWGNVPLVDGGPRTGPRRLWEKAARDRGHLGQTDRPGHRA